MAITSPVYATREDVKNAIDYKSTARSDEQVDRAVEAGSRAVEGLLHRKFYPQIATRYFDWPNHQLARAGRLWLEQDELISLTSISSGGTAITPGNVFLEPVNDGPPYDRIECNLGTSAAFSSGSTWQRAISVTGLWGYENTTTPGGALTASGINASVTSIVCTNSALIGVGSIITIDSEKMIVTDKAMVTTSTTLSGSSLASMADTIQAVSSGAAHNAGETILMGSEKMLVVEIASNNLTVIRAWDGSVLATHSGSTIFAPRTLTVQRGALGTTAASHLASAAITVQTFPSLVKQLAIGEAVSYVLQEQSGFARTVGSGDDEREARVRGITQIRQDAYMTYGRKARMRSVV